jgi:hypothetical protein
MIVFMFHPAVVADDVNAIAPATMYTPNANAVVEPKSVVVVSVKLTALPDHIAMICPALALEPDLAVYSNQAPSYELVETEYMVVDPMFAVDVVDVYNALLTDIDPVISAEPVYGNGLPPTPAAVIILPEESNAKYPAAVPGNDDTDEYAGNAICKLCIFQFATSPVLVAFVPFNILKRF